MTSTLRNHARKALLATLAGAALTAGLGLGGAGVANAQATVFTCLDNLSVTTTVTDHGKSVTLKTQPQAQDFCLSSNEVRQLITFGNTPVVTDPTAPASSLTATRSEPTMTISNLDPTSGAVRVALDGNLTREDKLEAGRPLAHNQVALPGLRPGHYVMRDVVTDKHGRTADTTASFTVFSA